MAHTPKVFIARPDVPDVALKLLRDYELDVWSEYDFIPRQTFLKRIAGKDALFISASVKVDAEALDAAGPNLRVIATMSSGLDHIDVSEVRKRGIKLGSTMGILEDAVAELAIGLLIAGMRKFNEGRDHIVANTWPKWMRSNWMNGRMIKGSVVGILGFGHIGSCIANKIIGFQPERIVYVARSPKKDAEKLSAVRVSLDELCKQSDIIIVSLALNGETKEILNEDKFDKMKRNAFLVNISRGGVIDQNALVKALKEEKIAGAALDVMTPEPLPENHELLFLKNLTLLPHIGSAEVSTRLRMAIVTCENIVAGLSGKPLSGEVC